MSLTDSPEERLEKARSYREKTGFTLPELWRHENPGKHELGIYGQSSADGWFCKGCAWQSSNIAMSENSARAEHDAFLKRLVHQHDDWMIREAPSGDKYCAACGEVVEYVYPEHEKLKKVVKESQAIGEFMEWLEQEKDVTLCKTIPRGEEGEGRFWPSFTPIQELLADFFGIDLKVIEQEKRAMLDKMRELNDAE